MVGEFEVEGVRRVLLDEEEWRSCWFVDVKDLLNKKRQEQASEWSEGEPVYSKRGGRKQGHRCSVTPASLCASQISQQERDTASLHSVRPPELERFHFAGGA